MPDRDEALLVVTDLSVGYGRGSRAVVNANLSVAKGEIALILGPNGAGKTSLVRGIAGFLKQEGVRRSGSVRLRGAEVIRWQPDAVARAGVCFIPEQGKIFPSLTVTENLEVFADRRKSKSGLKDDLEHALTIFPSVRARLSSQAGLMSGGERQMLALCGAVISGSDLVIVDEPSQGLAPIVVEQVIESLKQLQTEYGVGVLLVDQNMRSTVRIADSIYIMNRGNLVRTTALEVEERLLKVGYGEPA